MRFQEKYYTMSQQKSYVPVSAQRIKLARHLYGEGIEIGALHRPLLPLPDTVTKITYLDRKTTPELRQLYPNLAVHKLVEVGLVGKAESLDLEHNSQDFIIANHLIEHTEGTFQTLENFCNILKPGGILYMAVPDKRFTFDRFREAVTYEHLAEEYHHGFEQSRPQHYRDWVTNVNVKHLKKTYTPEQLEAQIEKSIRDVPNIHFHAWRCEDFVEHMFRMRYELGIPLKVIDVGIRQEKSREFIVVFQKEEGHT